MTAVKQQTSRAAALPHGSVIMKTMGTIMLDGRFLGKINTVAVYDLSGKLVATKAVTGKYLDLTKECGAGEGVFVVKVK
jgi:uncharacterized protein YrrD